MNWESRYVPPDQRIWQGRADIPDDSCFYQHIRLLNLFTQEPVKSADLTFALLGFKSDEGVQRDLGRTGAVEGPTAIRQRLARLPVQKPDNHIYDAGNIICNDHDLETSQQALAEVVSMFLARGIRPIIIGGGHEVAFGHYQGIARTYPQESRLGIINFDAHFDLHHMHPANRGSSSTAFFQIAESHKAEKRSFDYNCIGIQHAGDIRQSFETAKKIESQIHTRR